MSTTSGRSRGRQGVHSRGHGAASDHQRKIMATMVAVAVLILSVLVMTTAGHDIDAATQHFMLFYAGVFALIGLTGSVLVGLVATDRVVMGPGHRVMAQAVHRAVSFGALAFLVIHIVTEILAQRVHVIDAFIPFLSPFRTFYIGLGTIASDLILLIVVTSILRKRFTAHGKAWRWRAIHYTAYAAFVFGVLHGLLGGRDAKPYVDWSYGFAIAVTALGLVVRFVAVSLRPKENLSSAPGMARPRAPGPSPLHAAALSMAQARLGGAVQVLPAGMASRGAPAGMGSDSWAALPAAAGWSSPSGPFASSPSGPFAALDAPAALGAAPAYAAAYPSAAYPSGPSAPAGPAFKMYGSAQPHRDPGFRPLGAPPYGDDSAAGRRGRPYLAADSVMPGMASPGPAGPGRAARQPLYEPEYDGPPRFVGAPRGDLSQDGAASYPYSQPRQRPQLSTGYPGGRTNREEAGGQDRPRSSRAIEPPRPGSAQAAPRQEEQRRPEVRNTGPIPRSGTGPMPRSDTGPMPRAGTGPMARADTGPMPRGGTGPMARADTGPMPRDGTGPMSRPGTGPAPGQNPRAGAGPEPATGRGPFSRADSGPIPRAGPRLSPRPDTGPMPRVGTGPMPRPDTGPIPRVGTGPMPRPDTGPIPRVGTGPMPRQGTGPMTRVGMGPMPRPDTGPIPRVGAGPVPRPETGPIPRVGTGPMPRLGHEPAPWPGSRPIPGAAPGPGVRMRTGQGPTTAAGPGAPPETGPTPRTGPGPAGRTGLGPPPRPDTGPMPPSGPAAMPRAGSPVSPADPASGLRGDQTPGEAARVSRRTNSADPRYRDVTGPHGSNEWR